MRIKLITAQENILDNYFVLKNEITNPQIEITNTYVDVVPKGIVNTNLAEYPSSWFETVTFKGAFDPAGSNWLYGWTLLHESGRIK